MPGTFGYDNVPDMSSYASLVNITSSIVSLGNYALAQKVMLASIPFASIAMYLLLRHGVRLNVIPSLTGGILYAFGPISSHNFGTGEVW